MRGSAHHGASTEKCPIATSPKYTATKTYNDWDKGRNIATIRPVHGL
jgi:hypothetical protein